MKKRIACLLAVLLLLVGCTLSPDLPQQASLESASAPIPQPEERIVTLPEKSSPDLESQERETEPEETEESLTPPQPDTPPLTPHPLKEISAVTDEDLAQALDRPLEELSAVDNTSIVWGPGISSGEEQPSAVLQLQQQYGDSGAYFLMPGEEIYLSFDEGYELGYTASILDGLQETGTTGVFFVTLGYVQSRPDLIQRMIEDGHIIGNHSSAHPVGGMPALSTSDMGKDILYLHNYVKENFDYEMTLFRPPEGTFSLQSLQVAQSLGYQSIFWSFAYNDWNPETQMDPQEALLTITQRSHPGAIYLLHAVSSTNATILVEVIQELEEKGYTFSDWSHMT